TFKDIFIKDVYCSSAGKAMYFYGLPEHNISNIQIENYVVHSRQGADLLEAENILLKNVSIFPQEGVAVHFGNVRNVVVEGLHTGANVNTVIAASGSQTKNVVIKTQYDSKRIKLSKNLPKNQVKVVRQ